MASRRLVPASVRDRLLGLPSRRIREQYADTGGFTDHAFAAIVDAAREFSGDDATGRSVVALA